MSTSQPSPVWRNRYSKQANALERDNVSAVVLLRESYREAVEQHDVLPRRVVRVKRRLASMPSVSASFPAPALLSLPQSSEPHSRSCS